MISRHVQENASMDSSSTESRVFTEASSHNANDEPPPCAYTTAPAPRGTYIIRVKNSDLVITLASNELHLCASDKGNSQGKRWLCVENGIFFGFYNKDMGVYLGHNGKGGMTAVAKKFGDWEKIIPRPHPSGGYELVSPHWFFWKWTINVVGDCKRLVRTKDGFTLWEFERVVDA